MRLRGALQLATHGRARWPNRPSWLRFVAVAIFQLKHLTLRTRDLTRGTAFYTEILGLQARPIDANHTELSAAPDSPALIVLRGAPSAPPRPRGTAGLFHVAILLHDRAHLAAAMARLTQTRWPIQGLSDHGVSEAIYLADPDGNGVELYRDRPAVRWPRAGDRLAMNTQRLDVAGVLAAMPSPPPASPMEGAVLGHVHLEVTDLDRSRTFYERELGLAVRQDDYPGAVFLAAEGYHHHIAVNTWARARRPASPDAVGLVEIAAASASVRAPQQLADPDGIRLALAPL